MATIFKRKELRPIPDGANIVNYRGKPHAQWINKKSGKLQRAPLNAAGNRIQQVAEFYTIQYFDEHGRRQKVSTRCAEKDSAQQVANNLEREADLRRRGMVDTAAERYAQEGCRRIDEHVADFRELLVAKGNTGKHVEETVARVEFVLGKARIEFVHQLSPSLIQQAIKGIRDRGRSVSTANSYLRAVKSFSNWLRKDKRTPDDALMSLKAYNAKEHKARHARRDVTPEELEYLLWFVEQYTTPTHRMPGPDRAVLYRVALGTGYRVNELRSLTPASFDLQADPPTITVEAAYSKRRRRDEQPIRTDLAVLLRLWLADRKTDERVFRNMPRYPARTLKADLDAARAAWIKEAETDDEVATRRKSQFLRYVTKDGEYADFHAFRHTYISGIVASGASVKTAQTLARHSSVELTVGRYSHTRLQDLQGAVESLPSLVTLRPSAPGATDTEDDPGRVPWEQIWEQLGGETGQNVSGIGKQVDRCLVPAMPNDADPQVVTLSPFGNKKATSDETWLGAEGTGVEPATGKPAPDFESGC